MGKFVPNKKGLDELLRSKGMLDGMMNTADEGVDMARADSPVESGEYKSSWVAERGDNPRRSTARIENTSDHAAAVEFGNQANGYDAQRILGRVAERLRRA